MPVQSQSRRASAAQTRQLILDAARALFAEHGYRGTSIADIADAAGLAPGTIYVHFDNKDDLFARVIEAAEPNELSLDDDSAAMSIEDTFRLVAELTVAHTQRSAPFVTAMAHEARKRPETRRAFYEQSLLGPLRAITELLARFPALRNTPETERRALAHILLGGVIFTVLDQHTLGGADCHPVDLNAVPGVLGRLAAAGIEGLAQNKQSQENVQGATMTGQDPKAGTA
jgi:AcrR family transcriptional regulator